MNQGVESAKAPAVERQPSTTSPAAPTRLIVFVSAVAVFGAAAILHSVRTLDLTTVSIYTVLLAAATIASGRFSIKVPGRSATVSVSEFFVFVIALLYGPAAATLTVAADGLWTSLTQRRRRLYRTLFNIAEPAISIWAAAEVFRAVMQVGVQYSWPDGVALGVANTAMAATFFVLNSGLTAVAIAIESGASADDVWRAHAWYLGVNYYAAASMATLAVEASDLNPAVIGLVLPLLVLSYVTYREASSRVDDAQRHTVHVERLYKASVEMLAVAVETKDQVTHGHIYRVQRHTLAVARALGVTDETELKAIEAGALLHDIGKLAVSDYVLNKPSSLTTAEFEAIKTHVTMGARILTAVDFPYPVMPIVRHHHEQWCGRGYPDGLAGREIPLGARILAVVDCFDALTSDRPYRPRMSDERAVAILRERQGSFYDPAIVDRFIEMIPALRRQDAAAGDGHATERVSVDHRWVAAHVGRAIASPVPLNVRSLLARTGRELCCELVLYATQDGDVLRPAYASDDVAHALDGFQLAMGEGLSGWVAANRSTIRQADPALDLDRRAAECDLNSCTSTPVFVRGELFGVLTAYRHAQGPVPDQIIGSVGMLAQQVGLALAHAPTAGAGRPALRATQAS
jgi:putative nucleotidyltransferase with HDIG domain